MINYYFFYFLYLYCLVTNGEIFVPISQKIPNKNIFQKRNAEKSAPIGGGMLLGNFFLFKVRLFFFR